MPLILDGTGKIRATAGSDAISINSSNKTTIRTNDDGLTSTSPATRSTDIKRYNPSATTGWYWLSLNGNVGQYFIDMDYDGGGWVLVGTHPQNVALPSLTYAQAGTGYDHLGSSGFVRGTSDPSLYATWVGVRAWDYITAQNGGVRTCVYFVSTARQALGSVNNHTYRSRWNFSGFKSSLGWQGANGVVNEVGGSTPGFYYDHAVGGYNFSTYDNDQDAGGSNCSTIFGNSPWWYESCWDGNFWGANGSGGYANAPYWTGSAGNYHAYGAIYVR